jgi:hypothetical protein
VQAVVVCALFDPLFAAAMLTRCGEVDAAIHLQKHPKILCMLLCWFRVQRWFVELQVAFL